MAAISFPSSPSIDQIHTVGSRSWKYNGTAWKLVPRTTDAVVEGSNNLYFTNARVASAPAVSALEGRASAIESDISDIESAASTLAGRVTTAEGNISTLTSGLATEKGRVDAILSAAEADKDSFAEIVSLINSVDTTNDNAFSGYVTSNNAAVSGLTTRVTAAEGDIDALETRAGNIESAATSLAGRVTTAESDIDALETGKQIKDVVSATAPSHTEGLRWVDSNDMTEYLSYNGAWVELDKQ